MQQDGDNYLAFSNATGDSQSNQSSNNTHPYRSFKNHRGFQNNRYRNRPGFGFSNSNQNNFSPQNYNSPKQGFQNSRKFQSNQNRGYQQYNNFQNRNKFTPHKSANNQVFSAELYYHSSMIEDPWKNCVQHNDSPFGDKPGSKDNCPETTSKASDEEDKSPSAAACDSDSD